MGTREEKGKREREGGRGEWRKRRIDALRCRKTCAFSAPLCRQRAVGRRGLSRRGMQTNAADQLHRTGGSLVAPSRRPHSATERNHEQREDHSRAARQPASGRQEPHKQPPPWALAQTLHGSRRQRGGGNTPVSTASTTWTTPCLCSGSLLLGPATSSRESTALPASAASTVTRYDRAAQLQCTEHIARGVYVQLWKQHSHGAPGSSSCEGSPPPPWLQVSRTQSRCFKNAIPMFRERNPDVSRMRIATSFKNAESHKSQERQVSRMRIPCTCTQGSWRQIGRASCRERV